MSEKLVGIFYLVKGRIIAETAPVSTIKASAGVRIYRRRHYQLWSDLQKKDPDLYDLDCYALPRGSVNYNEDTKEFEITADQHILKEDRFINRIMKDFHLDKSEAEFKEDEHCRCAICKSNLKA